MKGDGLDVKCERWNVKDEKGSEELKNIKNAVLRDNNTLL